ncbi:MAG TPA: hypothetical protein VKZ93_08765, partial [Arenibacter sp.]|nr:hypothetical protein [Arenibacter sp.]
PTREAFEGRWQGPGTSNTFGRPSGSSGDDIRDYANSLWVENGEYLRVRDITLGYTLPASWTSKIKIASARVYASGQNLITVTKYSGYDPEAAWSAASINGWDRGVFPSSKSITFGVNLGF